MKPATKSKTRKEIVTLWKYAIGSTISYLINLAIVIVMTDLLEVHYLLSSIAGYASIVITSYIFSVTWIFTERKIASRGKEFVAFTLITIFAMLMNLVSMWFFTGYLHWHYVVSNVVTNFLATFWGYVPKKLFLFSGKKRKPSEIELEEVMPSFDDVDELPTTFIYEDEVDEK
ncbi:MAG: GtrA family protein [Tidjanibacter sp.]|nr:GtrA family protein [Tidjanibacter sp.]MBR3682778.1 GtrA family protein [Tidjanibacter sp.]MBR3853379.1 GtrA family protein [Tidjanibacter sp.]MBR7129208.1 GtrA family protein [Tidjanibacter sp.]